MKTRIIYMNRKISSNCTIRIIEIDTPNSLLPIFTNLPPLEKILAQTVSCQAYKEWRNFTGLI